MKFKSTRFFLNKKANSTKNGLSVGVHASNRHGDFFKTLTEEIAQMYPFLYL